MKSIHVLTMMTLLATAAAVSAQTPSLPSYPQAKELAEAQRETDQQFECPFVKAIREASAALHA